MGPALTFYSNSHAARNRGKISVKSWLSHSNSFSLREEAITEVFSVSFVPSWFNQSGLAAFGLSPRHNSVFWIPVPVR